MSKKSVIGYYFLFMINGVFTIKFDSKLLGNELIIVVLRN